MICMISGEWGRECGDATAGGSATKLGLNLGDWYWRTGGRVEIAYLVPWWGQLAGFRAVPPWAGSWNKGWIVILFLASTSSNKIKVGGTRGTTHEAVPWPLHAGHTRAPGHVCTHHFFLIVWDAGNSGTRTLADSSRVDFLSQSVFWMGPAGSLQPFVSTLVLKVGVLTFQLLPQSLTFSYHLRRWMQKRQLIHSAMVGCQSPSDCRTFKGCTENEGKGSFGCLRGCFRKVSGMPAQWI